MSRAALPRRHVPRTPHVPRTAHPLEDSLAAITIVLGLATFVTGAVHGTHLVASFLGVVAFFLGLYSQLVSATTAERWLNVIGIGLAFVGLGLGLTHGGFTL